MSERFDLIRLWLDLHRGHRTMSDEGFEKDRMTPLQIADYNDRMGETLRIDLGVTEVESRAGQYVRRLRRLAQRRAHSAPAQGAGPEEAEGRG